jgi:hypothetical protein
VIFVIFAIGLFFNFQEIPLALHRPERGTSSGVLYD